ncbi:MAG: ABC transporter permease [Acidimicrobiales bacterium]
MNRIIHAELNRWARRRVVLAIALSTLVFSTVSTISVFASVQPAGEPSRQEGATITALSGTGGGTEAFAIGASFGGFLVFVIIIALMAGEFSGGTFRAMLLRNPNRSAVIVGKLVALLLVAAAAMGVTELFSFVGSLLMAPTQDVSTSEWFTAASLRAAAGDFGNVMAGVTGWAVFGTTLAVLLRSTPLALGLGFAWAGPIENIIVDSWSTGYRVFPGQILGSLIRGGTVELGMGRALTTAAVYTAAALGATLLLVARRDVTA